LIFLLQPLRFAYLNTPGAVANPNIDRGDSDFDIRHSFTAGVTYDLPSPESNKIARAALGSWSVDSFIFARTAPPVDLIGAFSFTPGALFHPRPIVNPGVPLELYGSQYPGGKIFNKAARFRVQCTARVWRNASGSCVAAAISPPREVGSFSSGLSSLTSSTTRTTPLFAQSTQMLASFLGSGGANGSFNLLYQIGGPRSIQLALKLQF
jgi:hypothetical protein